MYRNWGEKQTKSALEGILEAAHNRKKCCTTTWGGHLKRCVKLGNETAPK